MTKFFPMVSSNAASRVNDEGLKLDVDAACGLSRPLCYWAAAYQNYLHRCNSFIPGFLHGFSVLPFVYAFLCTIRPFDIIHIATNVEKFSFVAPHLEAKSEIRTLDHLVNEALLELFQLPKEESERFFSPDDLVKISE